MTAQTLTWSSGGQPSTYKERRAGRWGCDPCWDCGKRPPAGMTIWVNCYGDIYCNDCARRRVAKQCESHARKGTGTGICDRPLDEHGQCDRASDHIGI